MTHPDYEAGRNSAYMGHPEPSPVWATLDFHLGWIDFLASTIRMTPRERRNASEYRAEVVRAYRGTA
jgi:hypothetical protein